MFIFAIEESALICLVYEMIVILIKIYKGKKEIKKLFSDFTFHMVYFRNCNSEIHIILMCCRLSALLCPMSAEQQECKNGRWDDPLPRRCPNGLPGRKWKTSS